MIKLRNFGFLEKHAKKTLLKDLSLEISAGEFVSVLGPNGAGKTTFLKCLFGLLDYSGEGQLLGVEINRYSRKALAQKVSYIPQLTTVLPNFSVREFVFMGRHPYLTSVFDAGRKQYDIVDAALAEANCEELSARLLSTLSAGERQS